MTDDRDDLTRVEQDRAYALVVIMANRFATATVTTGEFCERLRREFDAMGRTARGHAWRQYHRAGCPNGESWEGVRRWMNDNGWEYIVEIPHPD